jgi:hypothetical protein
MSFACAKSRRSCLSFVRALTKLIAFRLTPELATHDSLSVDDATAALSPFLLVILQTKLAIQQLLFDSHGCEHATCLHSLPSLVGFSPNSFFNGVHSKCRRSEKSQKRSSINSTVPSNSSSCHGSFLV